MNCLCLASAGLFSFDTFSFAATATNTIKVSSHCQTALGVLFDEYFIFTRHSLLLPLPTHVQATTVFSICRDILPRAILGHILLSYVTALALCNNSPREEEDAASRLAHSLT